MLKKALKDLYRLFILREYKGKTPVVGIYQGVKASLLVIDPEVAKKIMITDFSHFTDTTGVFDVSI